MRSEIGQKWAKITAPEIAALKNKDDLVAQVQSKYQLDKAPPGMKVTTDGKISWEVPTDFAADEAEVSLKVTDVRPLLTAVHTFRIAIEK